MVLVSGAGTTLTNLCSKIRTKVLDAKITCVIGNHANIGAADMATRWGLPYYLFDPMVYPPKEQWNDAFHVMVDVYKPGLVILAGFDRLLKVPPGYNDRILNIHPSLLPKYGGKGMYGDRVHRAVLHAGDKYSGCTVHVVDDQYDTGRILGKKDVDVHSDDTPHSLRRRVQEAERDLFPKVIQSHLDNLIAKNLA